MSAEAEPPQPRRMRLTGLHHVTLICRDLARTTGFYRDVLGLGLIRESVSDDDPNARHFWFSAGDAAPGTLLSFLEYPSMPAASAGPGAVQHFAFVVESPEEQVAWRDYLRGRGVQCTDVLDRGVTRSLYLRDPDGTIIEIATRGPGFSASAPASS